MLCKTLPNFRSMKLSQFRNSINFSQPANAIPLSTLNNMFTNAHSKNYQAPNMMIGSKMAFSFSTSISPNSFKPQKDMNRGLQTQQLKDEFDSLIRKIQEVAEIRRQRIQKFIQQKVQKELQSYLKQLRKSQLNQEGQINFIIKEKLKIQTSFSQNQEFTRLIEFNENYRAMIMIRLAVLWNEKYEQMTIDQLIYLINKLEECKELKNNELKSMAAIFLTVQTLRKCILSPRLNRNMICSTKSLTQNFSYMMKCFKGEMQARQNYEKVQNLLAYLLNAIEKNSNRYCFMKVQSQLQFLIAQIFKSFNQPQIYDDKSKCLLSNPPRVIFDEPFHQQYDRFIEMAVLVLFDKRLKKQGKINKLESITEIFQQIKTYEENKLKQSYEKERGQVTQIKKLKRKVIKMDKRVSMIQWIQNFVGKSFPK